VLPAPSCQSYSLIAARSVRKWRLVHSTGDIEVDGDVMRVILEPQSAPHLTRALKALCEELNCLAVKFPRSDLRLHYEVSEPSSVS
jgi:hypothetical protein